MNPDERRIHNKGNGFRGAAHIGIGLLYIAVGCMVGYYKTFGAIVLSNAVAYSITALMVLYGVFRIYRGWMDMRRS
jgi:hypothetical protein